MPIPKLGNITYKIKRSAAGLGLFAGEPVKRGTWIIEYVGKVVRGTAVDAQAGKYLFETSRYRMVNGNARSNTARYINHSCKPNCEVDIIAGRIFIKATKRIEAGDEFTYDYGKEYVAEYIKPHGCRCAPCRTVSKK